MYEAKDGDPLLLTRVERSSPELTVTRTLQPVGGTSKKVTLGSAVTPTLRTRSDEGLFAEVERLGQEVPGPGRYFDWPGAAPYSNKLEDRVHTPSLSTLPGNFDLFPDEGNPGPGEYEARRHAVLTPKFGSGQRTNFIDDAVRAAMHKPGPGAHDPNTAFADLGGRMSSSVRPDAFLVKDGPGPGAHDPLPVGHSSSSSAPRFSQSERTTFVDDSVAENAYKMAPHAYAAELKPFELRPAPFTERRFGTHMVLGPHVDVERGANPGAFLHATSSERGGGFRKVSAQEYLEEYRVRLKHTLDAPSAYALPTTLTTMGKAPDEAAYNKLGDGGTWVTIPTGGAKYRDQKSATQKILSPTSNSVLAERSTVDGGSPPQKPMGKFRAPALLSSAPSIVSHFPSSSSSSSSLFSSSTTVTTAAGGGQGMNGGSVVLSRSGATTAGAISASGAISLMAGTYNDPSFSVKPRAPNAIQDQYKVQRRLGRDKLRVRNFVEKATALATASGSAGSLPKKTSSSRTVVGFSGARRNGSSGCASLSLGSSSSGGKKGVPSHGGSGSGSVVSEEGWQRRGGRRPRPPRQNTLLAATIVSAKSLSFPKSVDEGGSSSSSSSSSSSGGGGGGRDVTNSLSGSGGVSSKTTHAVSATKEEELEDPLVKIAFLALIHRAARDEEKAKRRSAAMMAMAARVSNDNYDNGASATDKKLPGEKSGHNHDINTDADVIICGSRAEAIPTFGVPVDSSDEEGGED